MNCRSTYKVEMHHIRKMKDIKNKKDHFWYVCLELKESKYHFVEYVIIKYA